VFGNAERGPHLIDCRHEHDLSNAEWECLDRHLPAFPRRGRPRKHSLRAICHAIFYLLRTGCAWRHLPSSFPPWPTVFSHVRRWRLRGTWYHLFTALRTADRERLGRYPHPSAAIMNAQSVKTVEESAGICGYDSHKHVRGRKRHLLVDTVHPGNLIRSQPNHVLVIDWDAVMRAPKERDFLFVGEVPAAGSARPEIALFFTGRGRRRWIGSRSPTTSGNGWFKT
jgi:transposase